MLVKYQKVVWQKLKLGLLIIVPLKFGKMKNMIINVIYGLLVVLYMNYVLLKDVLMLIIS